MAATRRAPAASVAGSRDRRGSLCARAGAVPALGPTTSDVRDGADTGMRAVAAASGAVGAEARAAASSALESGPGALVTTPTTLEGVVSPNARARCLTSPASR